MGLVLRRRRSKPSPQMLLLWAIPLLIFGLLVFFLIQSSCRGKVANEIPATESQWDDVQPANEPPPSTDAVPSEPIQTGRMPPIAASPTTATSAKSAPPRIALVIDDLGQADSVLVSRLGALSIPLTVAVLPFLSHSKENARAANSMGAEVILHMPMEPIGYPGKGKNPGEGAIFYSQTEAEVRSSAARAMEDIPYANGLNNHMGSRITPDRDRMGWILEEAKKRNWYFLDSRTEKDTVALEVARELGIPALERKVFLDDDPDPVEMARQWERAMSMAKQEGRVVIIGHIHPETVAFLEKTLPNARVQVQFVKASVLAR
ncbi:MAG: divergent polysaccharide deacetylase family protein [Holophagaceae bacterium]|nr:divergent polysaccharide deacetylase family protein [Holophagaceae bacterium]